MSTAAPAATPATASAAAVTIDCSSGCNGGTFCIEPYLQNLVFDDTASCQAVDQPSKVSAMFQLSADPQQTPTVTWALSSSDTACENLSGHATSAGSLTGQANGPERLYYADLTCLEPGRTYCYQARIDGVSSAYSLFHVPETPPASYSFYVYGDTRANTPCETSNPAHAQVVATMLEPDNLAGTRFILNNGDFANHTACQANWWDQFFDQAQPLLARLPMFTAPGNHEYYDCRASGSCTQTQCSNSATGTFYASYFEPDTSYTFDYGNSRFIALELTYTHHTSEPMQTYKLSSQQMSWLQGQLDSAESDLTIDHVFLFYHAPLLTLARPGHGHECSDWQIGNLAPLLEAHGKVRAVFNGHTHYYQRSHKLTGVTLQPNQHCAKGVTPIDYQENDVAGIAYVVAGGGGAGTTQPGTASWVAAGSANHHFVKVTVSGPSVYAEAVGVPDTFAITPGLASGSAYTCELSAAGEVACWGSNELTSIGNSSAAQAQATPLPVQWVTGGPLVGAGQIDANEYHSCAALAGGTAACWGYNGSGALGNGMQGGWQGALVVLTDTAGNPLTGIAQVSANYEYSCALMADTTARCWGSNSCGQLGNGQVGSPAQRYPAPVVDAGNEPLRGIARLSSGLNHNCALMNGGTVQCWGCNAQGQLGFATSGGAAQPTPGTVMIANGGTETPLDQVVELSANAYATCVRRQDGSIWCWGNNGAGRLGQGVGGVVPKQVAGISNAVALATSSSSTCAVDNTGEVWCWGGNQYGQLGPNGGSGGPTPVQVTGLPAKAAAVSVGNSTQSYGGVACALLTDGSTWCWGDNAWGQLGTGTVGGTSATPVQVLAP